MTCGHGYPKPTMCRDCMDERGLAPTPAPAPPLADRWIRARSDGRCAANPDHDIEPGDLIGDVAEIGWVCDRCAR